MRTLGPKWRNIMLSPPMLLLGRITGWLHVYQTRLIRAELLQIFGVSDAEATSTRD